MTKLEEGVMEKGQLQHGLILLQKRQRNFMLLFLTSLTLLVATVLAGFLQQDLVYSFLGLNTEVKQLHIPLAAANVAPMTEQSDYFFSLIGWFAWFVFKVFVSFIGAFFVIAVLKKIRFFYLRFQSFVLKFVGWLIAFILLWSGLTYVQHDLKDDQAEVYAQWIDYDQNIHSSLIYQELQQQNTPQTVQAYVLAQTALLQQPADLATAKPYVNQLVNAEKQDTQFSQYGFQAEQLWTMQQQVYAQAMTPQTQALAPRVAEAQQLHNMTQWFVMVAGGGLSLITLLFWLLAHYFQKKSLRIEQRLHS